MSEKKPTDWCSLNPGDTVDIVAPASKCHPSVVIKLEKLLNSWGLRSQTPNDLFGHHVLYANTDEKRFAHLCNALTNQTSKAVWCLLGGFGTTRIIPLLNQIKPPNQSKIFIGFSDITALHIFLQVKWGWKTIHGPSGYQASLNKISKDSIEMLRKFIFHHNDGQTYENIKPLNELAKKNILIEAPLIGGNLTMIATTLGTPWQIEAENKILFIEETNERAYRVDRTLNHLKQAGILQNIKAILFGDVIDKGEPDGRFLVAKIIHDFAQQCNCPVFQISNIGHGPINNPILLGSPTQLLAGNYRKLILSTA